jgi:hypothetical protein
MRPQVHESGAGMPPPWYNGYKEEPMYLYLVMRKNSEDQYVSEAVYDNRDDAESYAQGEVRDGKAWIARMPVAPYIDNLGGTQ